MTDSIIQRYGLSRALLLLLITVVYVATPSISQAQTSNNSFLASAHDAARSVYCSINQFLGVNMCIVEEHSSPTDSFIGPSIGEATVAVDFPVVQPQPIIKNITNPIIERTIHTKETKIIVQQPSFAKEDILTQFQKEIDILRQEIYGGAGSPQTPQPYDDTALWKVIAHMNAGAGSGGTTDTDDQTLSLSSNTLSIQDGNSVNLSSYLDNTDTLADLSCASNEIAKWSGTAWACAADASGAGGTDDQTIDVFTLSSNTLSLSLEGDGEATKTLDFSAYLDNTDTQLTQTQVGTYATAEGFIKTDTDTTYTDAEIKTKYENNADTNAHTDAQVTKLSGIETSSDVTDTTNVTAAGALMDSEVDADLKTLVLSASTTITTFGATLTDDADAATARTTLGVAIGSDVQAYDANTTQIGQTIESSEITDNTVTAGDLSVAGNGTSGQVLTSDADGSFSWTAKTTDTDTTYSNLSEFTNDSGFVTSANDTVSGTELDGVFSTLGFLRRTAAGTYSTVTDNSTNWNTAFGWGDHSLLGYLTMVDISANTNLVAGTGITLTGDTLSVDLGTTIETGEITDATILNADISASAAIAYSKLNLAGLIDEDDLKATNAATDNYILSYDNATAGFTWAVDADTDTQLNETQVDTFVSNNGYLTSETDNQTVDVFTFSGDTLSLSLEGDGEATKTLDFSSYAKDADLHSAVTLAGSLDYLTITGQVITLGAIDLAADTTGTLTVASGGTGLASYTAGDILYASGSNTLAKLALGTNGQVLKLAAGVPSWGTDDSGAGYWTQSTNDIYYTTGSASVGTATASRKLSVYETSSNPQMRVSYDATNFSEFTVSATGDLIISAEGGDIAFLDENLRVCAGGACPTDSSTLAGNGNIIAENKVFAEGFEPASCPTGMIPVPASPQDGLQGFCIDKYEAKNVSGIATSQSASTPWVSITQYNARAECIQAGKHLTTEAEWLAVAHNAEDVGWNWNGGVAGTNQMSDGHSDNSPASALAASTDTDACSGTGQTCSDSVWNTQRRTYKFSNGEYIWDIGGNVWEWTDQVVRDDYPIQNSAAAGWQACSTSGDGICGNTLTTNDQWYRGGTTATRGFLRGSSWDDGTRSGAFTLILNDAPTYADRQRRVSLRALRGLI